MDEFLFSGFDTSQDKYAQFEKDYSAFTAALTPKFQRD
jgi:hypothetical protein